MRFDEFRLKPALLEKARMTGFKESTPIQKRCIDLILNGRDVVGEAETGSGKTVAFALPILDRLSRGRGIQVLVLTPTRELCVQVSDVFRDFGSPLGIRTISVYGGVSMEPQIEGMQTADIVVGTPGRVLDHLGRKNMELRGVRFLVLDETDKMFEMGFIEDVEEIIGHVPRERQTLMFSATMSYGIQHIIERHLHNPVIVRTRSYVDTRKLRQVYYDIYNQSDKFSLLVYLLRNHTSGLALVFCATRHESGIVASNLRRQRVNAMAIHGGMTQYKREKSLDALKHESIDVLVATDVAARGLDIKNVTHVYNYDVPKTAKEYIHRVGRTARAGESGSAVTLLTHRDHDNFRRILADEGIDVEREGIPDFPRLPFNRFLDDTRRERTGSSMHPGRGPHGPGRPDRYESPHRSRSIGHGRPTRSSRNGSHSSGGYPGRGRSRRDSNLHR
jgi:ATP-dependent RNA helicase DeaD